MRRPLRVVAWMLLLLVGLTAPDVAPLADDVGSHDQPSRTAKERLGVKARDEQRVDLDSRRNTGQRTIMLIHINCWDHDCRYSAPPDRRVAVICTLISTRPS